MLLERAFIESASQAPVFLMFVQSPSVYKTYSSGDSTSRRGSIPGSHKLELAFEFAFSELKCGHMRNIVHILRQSLPNRV